MLVTKGRLCVGLLIVLGLWAMGASAWIYLKEVGPSDPWQQLDWRARRAGFRLDHLPPYPAGASVFYGRPSQAADMSAAFRHWLISVVEKYGEPVKLREEALGSLMNMTNDRAVVAVMRDLLDWIEEGPEATGRDQIIPLQIRTFTWTRAMQAKLPDADLLRVLKRAEPQEWHDLLVQESRMTPEEIARRGETWKEIAARSKELLRYADSQQSGKAATE